MTEEWRPVKDFDDYQVSNLGRVKNVLIGRLVDMDEFLR